MKCKECKIKDAYIEALKKEYERVIKLNGEILDLAKNVTKTNGEVIALNQKLIDRVDELENKLKEAGNESCTTDSDNA